MCGICGFVKQVNVDDTIESMTSTLLHRGPDGNGCWKGNGAALGHTRLAIIDLTETGSQPMATRDGRYRIVFNGEIYNFQELRRDLEGFGERFYSNSDTEVILLGYRKWGRRVLDRLRGMFAFAIWDSEDRRLFLARDRIGIKPLFYALLSEGLLFASEIKAIFANPEVDRKLNLSAVDAYLTFGYIPGPETIFHGIHMLPPGTWLEWKQNRLESDSYWKPSFNAPSFEPNETDLTDELDERLNDAVRSHLVADVPIGSFLSGGIDSSLVSAIANRLNHEPIRTFTIGFHGGGDERTFAGTVARHIGTLHSERIAETALTDQLPCFIRHLEQPLSDNSILPTFLVSKLAREEVKVVLSGDGGDELFAGYDWTRFALSLPDLHLKFRPSGWDFAYRKGPIGLAQRLCHDVNTGATMRYLRRVTVSHELRHWLYCQEFSSRLGADPVETLKEFLSRAPVRDERERFLYADLSCYLPDDILFKVDRMSMANSLEVRVPLLDHLLLEWLFKLPFSMRFRNGRGKYLLRKVAARYLPPSILKPRKQGFTIPIGNWLRGDLGEMVKAVFSSRRFAERGILQPQAALTMLDMHRKGSHDLGHRIWSLFILEIWMRIWLDGDRTDRPLSELLRESGDLR